jgi:exopolysaccharide biosynthesis polyprenyl glycosylphosphotransferase
MSMPPSGTTEVPSDRAPQRAPAGSAPAPVLGPYDVRRKRPPALSFLLRWVTVRRLARIVSLVALDLAAVFLAILTALAIKASARDAWDLSLSVEQAKDYCAFAFLVTVLLFSRSGLYADRAQRPGLARIVASLFQVTVVALLFGLVSGEQFSSYYIFYGSLFFAVAYVSTFRFAYERVTGSLLRAAGYHRRAVLVGSGEQIEAVAHALADSADTPMEIVGFISLTPRPNNGLASLGTLSQLGDIVAYHRIDEVVIADPAFPQQQAVEVVDTCHRQGVVVRVAPSTMEILIHRAEFVPGQSVPLFELKPPVFEGFDYALKRSFDLVGSILLILALSPVLLSAALAVRLTSRGPVIYRSLRPGIGGRVFACLKFRTMYDDAEELQHHLEHHNEASGALFKIRDDPRMTPVGRLLRRFSIDELPQLFNVLFGQMSLVGPRPLPQRDFDRLEDWHRKRYLVLPGITGLWQVSGRSELDFDDLVRLDFLYLERWSVFLDLSILIKTIPAVFTRRGAF